MSATKGAPVILRYEKESERQKFVAAFANAFEILACADDQEALSCLASQSAASPALVVFSSEAQLITCSEIMNEASKAGCFRILITEKIALDNIIQLLDDRVIDRCYTQPWDENRLRADLFTATMAVDPRHWPEPLSTEKRQPLVLIVDDETAATRYLGKHLLRLQDQFGVRCAASADEALNILHQEGDQIAVMMTDQRMPGMKGVQLINELRQSFPYITRILTSAYGELDVALGAVNQGRIYRYEKKPWNAVNLLPVLEGAIAEHFRLRSHGETLRCEASSAFDAIRQQRRAAILNALATPAPGAIGPAEIIGRFLSDLETVTTLNPGIAHHRAVADSELDRRLIRELRDHVFVYRAPEQGSRSLQGHQVPSAIADALDILLAASGLTTRRLKVNEADGLLNIASEPENPFRMYSHALSPLAGISNPLIQQQAALLALYLWADHSGGQIHLTGAQHSFALTLSLPVAAIDAAIEQDGPRT